LDAPIYRPSPSGSQCLCQGEIISGVIRFRIDAATIDEPEPSVVQENYPHVIVMTQGCDLTQDFQSRRENKPSQLPDILFCRIPTGEELRNSTPGINSTIWDRVKKNKDERYHFLERIPGDLDFCGEGLPELSADFKRYFTLPTDEIYRRIELGMTRRRTVLCTPYLEHLSSRFAFYLSRVGLPREHVSE